MKKFYFICKWWLGAD